MLCGRIIITNESQEEIQNLTDAVKKRNAFFGFKEKDGVFIISFNASDEPLYEISCDVAEHISQKYIKHDIYRYIEREYSCFNGQEKEIIWHGVLNCREINELPGRIYVFLKTEDSINPEAFYRFMCTDISDAAVSFADEEAERLISLNDDREFIDFLKYFAAMSSASAERVDIIAEKNCLRIAGTNSDEGYNMELGSLDVMSEDILSELVALNPKKIIIHGKENYENSEYAVIINGVFENRIFFCGGCALCPDR